MILLTTNREVNWSDPLSTPHRWWSTAAPPPLLLRRVKESGRSTPMTLVTRIGTTQSQEPHSMRIHTVTNNANDDSNCKRCNIVLFDSVLLYLQTA